MMRHRAMKAARAQGAQVARDITVPLPVQGLLVEARTSEVSGMFAAELTNMRSTGTSIEAVKSAVYGSAEDSARRRIPFEFGGQGPVLVEPNGEESLVPIEDIEDGESSVSVASDAPAAPPAPEPDVPPVENPTPSTAAPRNTESTIRVETIPSDEVARIETDAKTFQYKNDGDTEGVTDRLQGITDWDERSAMGGIVYEYADGRRVVADGHQRLGLAKRLQAEGKKTPWNVEIIREADGYTPADVRRLAALKNIREGSGTAIDAAKVLRETPDRIDSLNLPPNSALVRDAKGLAKLSDDAFGAVINGVVPISYGAVVGQHVADRNLHLDVVNLLNKLKPANATQAVSIAQQAAQATTTETQSSLFGDEDVAQGLYLERAKILDAALSRIKKDRQTFKVLADRAETITSAGNRLDSQANAKRLETDSEMQAHLQAEANRKGPISDALTAAARDLKENPRQSKRIVGEFLDAIQAADQPDGGQPTGDQGDRDGGRNAGGIRPETRQDVEPPATERTEAGQQTVIPGAERDQKRSDEARKADQKRELEARQQQSKKGTATPQDGAAEMRANIAAAREKWGKPDDRTPANANDLTDTPEAADLFRDLAAAEGIEARGKVADAWVLARGKETGIEHLVVLDADGAPLSVTNGAKGNLDVARHIYRAAAEGAIGAPLTTTL